MKALVPASLFAALLAAALPAAAQTSAGVDTLSVESVLQRRNARLDSLLLPESTQFDTLGVESAGDSLDQGGVAAVRAHRVQTNTLQRRALQLGLNPLAMSGYDRIEGTRVGIGLKPTVIPHVSTDLAAAYGFANHRWSGRAGLQLDARPLPIVRVDWSERTTPFGPAADASRLLALVVGQDRRDYLRRRAFEVSLWPWRAADHGLGLRAFDWQDEPVAASTDFSLVGGDWPIDDPNPTVDRGRAQGIALQGHAGKPRGAIRVAAEVGVTGAAGDFDWSWQSGDLTLRHTLRTGDVASLALAAMSVGGSPPVQSVAYLGGEASLRGYERLEFAGKQSLSARFEYAIGLDLLQRTRLPLVEKLHVQFVPFFDAGTTWGRVRAAERTRGTLDGVLRSSFGLGLQRTLWLPGLEILRLDIARRTDGSGDGVSFWLRALHLDL